MPSKKTQGKERTCKRKPAGGKKAESGKASGKKGRQDRHETRVSGPRPFWSGTIAFGLVSLPVGLFPANRSKPVALRMIDENGMPLARRYFCEKEQRALTQDELVRGYEVEKNEFVVIKDRELDKLAPEKSQEIDLKRFVARDEIDPMFFERAYFLTPEKGATKAYRLLASSMQDAGRAGIATFVMRGKEYLIAIVAEKGILRAEALRFCDELRTPSDIGLPETEKADGRRVRTFEKNIKALTKSKLDREVLKDRHSQRVLERVHKKLDKGEDVIDAPEEPEDEAEQGGEVVDLMQVLKQSLAQGYSPVTGGPTGGKAESKGKAARGTRSEFYKRAQQLGIAGRSNMSKEQLSKAIGDAE
ncbi:DNA end-binding protein Ku [Modicisalibacter muralis]|uniref:Non-homologous end joining protein Ku n=1 Tax=Modicisalibacter muralis TaxID=119000 RepID=A0A1G9LPV1_9GAMM|nr:Ku protein [Halomonas muralis]SDL63960.1 DNA end-binding protein Ku [Halomonas muralis]